MSSLCLLSSLLCAHAVQFQFVVRGYFDYLSGAVGNFRMKLGLSNEKKVVYCDSGAMIVKSCIQSG